MNKLIIFDFDGTIVDSMWAWDELGFNTLTEKGLPIIPDYKSFIRTMSVPHFSEYLTRLYPDVFKDNLLSEWHKTMRYNYENKIAFKKGAREYLEYLKKKGYTLYLASATHDFLIDAALKHFGLQDFFDFVITENQVGSSKRDPHTFNICMQRAGATAENTILFEDANHALKTAHTLGIRTCAVYDLSMEAFEDEIKSFCDYYINDFDDELIYKIL